jgi:Ni/Fe-hydrogenase subunit HybB-like protein
MSKAIFWLVIVFGILFALRLLNSAKARKRERDSTAAGRGTSTKTEATVRCTRCGVFVPKTDARFGPGGITCGDPNCSKGR